ncbi:hypothetical protein [Mucilaginibacter sp. CSA2-8R]|uniref:hypothetical protein n=1 Tax=Mucilaginibacter sp. CSA2-8R TaxID=3141542 RepID=UPI00315CB500
MHTPKNIEIPVSRLSYNTIYTQRGRFDGEIKILYCNKKCVLAARNSVPWMLFVVADFNQNDLISAIGDDLYKIKRLVVQSTFEAGTESDEVVFHIPDWLLALKQLESLRFEQIIFDDLWLFRAFPVRELAFNKVKCNNEDILGNPILQFKELSAITYDDSLPQSLIDKISLSKPDLKLTFEA